MRIVTKALKLRLERGQKEGRVVTQQEVAETIGITRSALRRIERGETQGIDFDTLAKLCDYYEVTVGEVLEYDPQTTGHSASLHCQPD